jgi:hypothetical protein
MPRPPIGDTPMTSAERQARYRTARLSDAPVLHFRRPADRRSRIQRPVGTAVREICLGEADALWGDAAKVQHGLRAHFDAGATHVAIQPVHADGDIAGRDAILDALADT